MASAKKQAAMREILAPQMRPEETVQLIVAPFVGSVSAGKQAAVIAASALLTGGVAALIARPKGYYVAVTQQRLLFVEANSTTGYPVPPKGAPVALPRPLRMQKLRGLLYSRWLLLDGEGGAIAQIRFARVESRHGKRLAAALDS